MSENMAEEERFEERLRRYMDMNVAVCTAEEGCLCTIQEISVSDTTVKVKMSCPKFNTHLVWVNFTYDWYSGDLESASLRLSGIEKEIKITRSKYREGWYNLEDSIPCITKTIKAPIEKILKYKEVMEGVNALFEKCRLGKEEEE